MKKYVFKGKIFAWQDMLSAKHAGDNFIREFSSSNKKIKSSYNVNQLANSLHPEEQIVTVKEIRKETPDTKTLVLHGKGDKIAYFRAGQYISIHLDIEGHKIVRPYSISSSPKLALTKGCYEVTIKEKQGGFASTYLLNKIKVGTKLTITGPQGDFYYDELRDSKNILALARGSGITPFLSLAKAICDNEEDCNLTIIYGNKKRKDIVQEKELQELEKKSNGKVRVIHVISQEEVKKYVSGVICLDLIKKHYTKGDSIWMCGSKNFYKKILLELSTMKIPKKLIRLEKNNDIGVPENYPNYKNVGNKNVYNIVVHHFDKIYNIKARADETILVSLQRAKIDTKSNCLRGLCSWCRIRVIDGKYFSPKNFASLRKKDNSSNICYSCSSFPITDMVIESY